MISAFGPHSFNVGRRKISGFFSQGWNPVFGFTATVAEQFKLSLKFIIKVLSSCFFLPILSYIQITVLNTSGMSRYFYVLLLGSF
jgi:hypothetical protein